MSWFTKILGIDARRNAEAEAKKQTAITEKAAADAKAAQEASDATMRQYQTSMQNMQINAQNLTDANRKDLSTDTVSNVVAGGSADASAADAKKKKMLPTGGIAASLGINL